MVSMDHSAVDMSVALGAASGSPVAGGATVVAVLAVKSLHRAKSRLAATLASAFGHDDPTTRGSLVLAMFLDTVEALRGAGVSRVVVVSPDDDVLAAARRTGTHGLREVLSPTAGSGLNVAFGHGARWALQTWPDSMRVVFVQADLPAATSDSLRQVLHEAPAHRLSFLTDRDGTGTVLLHGTLAPDDTDALDDAPRFGPGSAAAHRAAGAVELDPAHTRWTDLRTDVDTATDLDAARALGLGPHTTEVLRRL
ncbi:UNVERIFIED_ORG: 2-phospho-L-lactate guanylyltransferase [Gordonia westfalica J30]